jgi:hypothetical protein
MIDMKRRFLIAALLLAAIGLTAAAQGQTESLTAKEILDRTRSAWQGESFHGVVELVIVLSGQTTSHVLEVWTLGEDYALLYVLEPEEDAGSGYLQVKDQLWYYSPLVGSAIEFPSIALANALFGSGPSIDDLSHGTLSDDYDVAVKKIETGWFLTLAPHPDAPVVYGKLEIRVSADFVIEEIVYYDQRDAVLRTATFSKVVEVDGKRVPTLVKIEDASGDRTIQRLIDPKFDADIDASFFTLETLVGGSE